jgi:glycine/serine hydroxymethyltransferase
MKEPEMARVAALIAEALRHRNDETALKSVRAQVEDLCAAFPAYPNGV